MDIFDTRLRQIDGKREWVGLTAEDIEGLRHRNANDFTLAAILYEAECILKEKNNGIITAMVKSGSVL
jgi:hypothetical protein